MPGVTFLDLPAELRNHIYTLVIGTDRDLVQTVHFLLPLDQPALLAVSRQVRRESLSMFYGDVTLEISTLDDPWLIGQALQRLGREQVAMSKEVLCYARPQEAYALLKKLGELWGEDSLLLESLRGKIVPVPFMNIPW